MLLVHLFYISLLLTDQLEQFLVFVVTELGEIVFFIRIQFVVWGVSHIFFWLLVIVLGLRVVVHWNISYI